MQSSEEAIADELCSAATLLMGQGMNPDLLCSSRAMPIPHRKKGRRKFSGYRRENSLLKA